ncbi:hypothetical protein [Roseateles oligotrophus]|uniref:Uncharacterized protein n=1 Tax=Roseateles oligotrophus TaxID=1769250 RepID=A0ABT2YM58_9BURK|nr:hypothetical protein [Roseateles oligotrophus]MCV2371129.1 hypothetical protein [Roseateles oligotrophus]
MTQALGPVQYFEVQSKAGQIILTPVRIQRGDALRAKLAELKIDAKTIESALAWAEPVPAKRARKIATATNAAVKPLSEKTPTAKSAVSVVSAVAVRQISRAPTAGLKASLSLVLAKAAKR